MTLTPEAIRRLHDDQVVWLTTITDAGAPAPNPVWCALDGDDVVVFTSSGSLRVRNIEARPTVALNFNSDELGGDLVIITGTASARPGRASDVPAYRAKYESAMRDLHQLTLEQFGATYDTELRIRPNRVRP